MNLIQLAEVVIGSIISIGILIAGAGYGFGKYYEGKNKASKDTLDLFNAEFDSLRKLASEQAKQIEILQADIKKHTLEIGRLGGVIEEKNKTISDLTALIQNRDPSLTEYIKFAREAILEFKDTVKRIHDRVDLNDKTSDKILSILLNK